MLQTRMLRTQLSSPSMWTRSSIKELMPLIHGMTYKLTSSQLVRTKLMKNLNVLNHADSRSQLKTLRTWKTNTPPWTTKRMQTSTKCLFLPLEIWTPQLTSQAQSRLCLLVLRNNVSALVSPLFLIRREKLPSLLNQLNLSNLFKLLSKSNNLLPD